MYAGTWADLGLGDLALDTCKNALVIVSVSLSLTCILSNSKVSELQFPNIFSYFFSVQIYDYTSRLEPAQDGWCHVN